MFSSRLRQGAARNRLSRALEARRAAGRPIADLTLSNPTKAGFAYPRDLLEALQREDALHYDPEPFGIPQAREAVAAELQRQGIDAVPARIVLTASTSEAYSLLFKLLCDPGDTVLAPRPSYPLVEHLAELDGVSLEHYSLEFQGTWAIDLHGLQRKMAGDRTGRIRAIIMISPNNPTGSVVNDRDLESAAALARDHGAALIADEVFADYPIAGRFSSVLRQHTALTFALGGLSKSVGLPQAKLGWIAAGGPSRLVDEALARLETICDAYLSVSTPIQIAAQELLKRGGGIREQIRTRVRRNYARLIELAAPYPACSVLPVEAGWYAVVQVPATEPEETLVLDLLDRTGVLVHPGYFFDFEREAYFVLSLLPEPATFASGAQAVFEAAGGRL